MSKSKTKTSKPLCSAEQAISAVNWDKQSTWETLNNRSNIEPWPEGKSSRAKKSQK